MIVPAKMVFGVLMEHDERVIYFHRDDPGWQKPMLIIVGVLTLIGIIGIFFILAGLMATTRVFVVTTKRWMIIEGVKKPKVMQLKHGEVASITKKIGSGGRNIQWFDLADSHRKTLLQYQTQANPKEMVSLFNKWIENPALMQTADSVWFDSVASAKATPKPTST